MTKFLLAATDKHSGTTIYAQSTGVTDPDPAKNLRWLSDEYYVTYSKEDRDARLLTDPTKATRFNIFEATKHLTNLANQINDNWWLCDPRIMVAPEPQVPPRPSDADLVKLLKKAATALSFNTPSGRRATIASELDAAADALDAQPKETDQ